MPAPVTTQDEQYLAAAGEFGPAIERLARAYENEPHRRQDLVQEIHIALWRSLAAFDGRCSMRTWVYRVGHNVAASHVLRDKRYRDRHLLTLEQVEPPAVSPADTIDQRLALDRLVALIQQLKPPDRQVLTLYLEGLDAATIGEIAGLSASHVAVKVHRIKALLTRQMQSPPQPGGSHV